MHFPNFNSSVIPEKTHFAGKITGFLSKVKRTNGIIDRIKFMALKHCLFFTERDLLVCVFVCVCVRQRNNRDNNKIKGQ